MLFVLLIDVYLRLLRWCVHINSLLSWFVLCVMYRLCFVLLVPLSKERDEGRSNNHSYFSFNSF
jgi:hypothetical protein